MIITPRNENCVYEIIESDEDLINLVQGDTYFRVWREGEFEVDENPQIQLDGSIILPTDSVVRLSENTETNIAVDLESKEKQEKFWRTHSVSHYIIKDGFIAEPHS